MPLELWQLIISHKEGIRGWWVSAAPISDTLNVFWDGPFKTVKDARIKIDKVYPKGDWITNRKYYTSR